MAHIFRTGRYSALSIALHWVTALLFVAVYATIELREIFPRGSDPREALKQWHFMLGLSIFALVWLRIVVRLTWRPSPGGADPAAWRRLLANLVHAALYVLMIGMPLAGWLILSAEGEPVPLFGLTLPPLTIPNEGFAGQVEELHELGGTIGYYLIGLHTLAALLHHYVLRDGAMSRMLPVRT